MVSKKIIGVCAAAAGLAGGALVLLPRPEVPPPAVPAGAPAVAFPQAALAVDPSRPALAAPVDPKAAAALLQLSPAAPRDELWRVGSDYYQMQRHPEAAAHFWALASSGDPRGASALGKMYVEGQGVIRDPGKGVFWLNKAASAGHRGAQFTLGGLYERGTAVPQDPARAAALYRASAEQGFVPAMKSLSLCLEFGRGLPRDRQQAVRWMQQAAAGGDREAPVIVAVLADARTPAMQDEKQLVAWVNKARGAPTRSAAAPAQGTSYPKPPPYPSLAPQAPGPVARAQPQPRYVAPPQAQAQNRQATPAEIREFNARVALMKQSMGFGGIFGGMLNSGMASSGSSGSSRCPPGYSDPAACNAARNGDLWAADRLQNKRSNPSERDWYNR